MATLILEDLPQEFRLQSPAAGVAPSPEPGHPPAAKPVLESAPVVRLRPSREPGTRPASLDAAIS